MVLDTSATHGAAGLPLTPDFDHYPITVEIGSVSLDGGDLQVAWSDGVTSRYHAIWLRDNAVEDRFRNVQTREQTLDISALPDDLAVTAAWIDGAGALSVRWSDIEDISRFHPGWLRAHDYSNLAAAGAASPPLELWDRTELSEPPTFSGTAILQDDEVLENWLAAIARFGIARLRGVTPEAGMVEQVVRRIGPLRTTNFGLIFDVRAKVAADSNAYTALELLPHVDLPTREYQPGLQFLHCLENTATGGAAVYVDGFKVAEAIRSEAPDIFKLLTTLEWTMTNRAHDTDYRWRTPVIVTDNAGQIVEIRNANFLRGPLATPFEQVEDAYRSLKHFLRQVREPCFRMSFNYAPGDLVGFDNRRILHGRQAFDPEGGQRWLQGCYQEREELHSRLRILARQRRA